MSFLTITKGYADSTSVSLTDSNLDNFVSSIETFFNTTKLNDNNFTNTSITGSDKLVDETIETTRIAANAVTDAKLASAGQVLQTTATGAHTTSSTSFAALTSATVTITTTGRPVLILVQPDGNGGGNGTYVGDSTGDNYFQGYRLKRDSTVISNIMLNENNLASNFRYPFSYAHLDTPSAGQYIYTLEYKSYQAAGTAGIGYIKIMAIEIW